MCLGWPTKGDCEKSFQFCPVRKAVHHSAHLRGMCHCCTMIYAHWPVQCGHRQAAKQMWDNIVDLLQHMQLSSLHGRSRFKLISCLFLGELWEWRAIFLAEINYSYCTYNMKLDSYNHSPFRKEDMLEMATKYPVKHKLKRPFPDCCLLLVLQFHSSKDDKKASI